MMCWRAMRERHIIRHDDPVEKKKGQDILYYIWAGPVSPVFGKRKMATFESYFIADKTS